MLARARATRPFEAPSLTRRSPDSCDARSPAPPRRSFCDDHSLSAWRAAHHAPIATSTARGAGQKGLGSPLMTHLHLQENRGAPRGSLDGVGASDHDQPYRFGFRPRTSTPYPFSTRQYARLLILRGRAQDQRAAGRGDPGLCAIGTDPAARGPDSSTSGGVGPRTLRS